MPAPFFIASRMRGLRAGAAQPGLKNLLTGGDGFYIKGKNKP